jgi:RimJ/RimL family protein N-acetyltransferase
VQPEVPEEVEGPRLRLVALGPADADELFAAIEASRPRLRPWMPWAAAHRSPADTREYADRTRARWRLREDLTYAIRVRPDGRLVGAAGLHPAAASAIDWSVPRFEIGYWLRTGEEGKGYATEAVRMLAELALGRLGGQRVEIRTSTTNVRSRRVAERAGFVLEGVMRHESRDPAGVLRDTLVFSRIPGDPAS